MLVRRGTPSGSYSRTNGLLILFQTIMPRLSFKAWIASGLPLIINGKTNRSLTSNDFATQFNAPVPPSLKLEAIPLTEVRTPHFECSTISFKDSFEK